MKYLEPKFTIGFSQKARDNWPFDPKCDRCGELMEEIKCKLICKKCGYSRDCSDP